MIENDVYVGTFHKTGTVWLTSVFKAIAQEIKIPFYDVSRYSDFYVSDSQIADLINRDGDYSNSSEPRIIFDGHSIFGCNKSSIPTQARGVRVVRSPVSIICSAAKYHTWSKESWLHKPMAIFNGLTYQQKINSLKDDNEKYRFEMENSSKGIINAMSRPMNNSNFFTVKYEAIVSDEKMLEIESTLTKIGFRGRALMLAMKSFWELSLFGELKAEKVNHIQNKAMNVYGNDWDEVTCRKYKENFYNDAIYLGYNEKLI
ncbi:sulfotransferase domain-containing protein [Alteromonas stellipolaris]|uniref:sulfotransferase domain-containing protein n=1 Tax=Alteromonas stellipolaris TaxID=233316 RepID=UPI001D68198C|nr:sulfotransferase domain-containing protein [Alteromonas stellipolaris]MBZ2163610.1 hypothetical protein [Alteromonas stellipolaris]